MTNNSAVYVAVNFASTQLPASTVLQRHGESAHSRGPSRYDLAMLEIGPHAARGARWRGRVSSTLAPQRVRR